ncbi:mas-related G-protein coupled receptor member X2-like [Camelus bactrianus]|uniref:Mas-related G-protein coupled receptor member X2-like n=1 Tax=Camelus bactrianus TaxID=9837 RepID=A0A9W3GZ52_CAMBA|nr:mas-related G-protein coupled receptor member X2-like [Camelus bactrianus]EQB79115.1 MAS-related GPR, member X2-like protein [Camelus ferus]
MVLRVTSGGFLSLDPTTPAWGSELTSVNVSGQALPQTLDMATRTLLSLTVIIAAGGLAGNATVLWLLGFRLRRNAFSVYIFNLAGADFLLLGCQIIISLMFITAFHSILLFYNFFVPVTNFAYIQSLSLLSAISTECCLSVLCPIWYRCRRPKSLSVIVCALLWALSLLLSILEGMYCYFLLGDFHTDWCKGFDFVIAGWLIFIFVLLAGSSLAMVVRNLCKSQRMQLTRLYVTILLTVLVFLLCGLPFGVYWFPVHWVIPGPLIFSYSHHLMVGLSCVNSCANPIIYFFVGSFRQWQRKRRGWQTLKVVLQKASEDVSEVDGSEGSFPQETQEISGSSLMF